MKTILNKIKSFFSNRIVRVISEVIIVLTFIVSYVLLWKLQLLLMLIAHVALALSLWVFIYDFDNIFKNDLD